MKSNLVRKIVSRYIISGLESPFKSLLNKNTKVEVRNFNGFDTVTLMYIFTPLNVVTFNIISVDPDKNLWAVDLNIVLGGVYREAVKGVQSILSKLKSDQSISYNNGSLSVNSLKEVQNTLKKALNYLESFNSSVISKPQIEQELKSRFPYLEFNPNVRGRFADQEMQITFELPVSSKQQQVLKGLEMSDVKSYRKEKRDINKKYVKPVLDYIKSRAEFKQVSKDVDYYNGAWHLYLEVRLHLDF